MPNLVKEANKAVTEMPIDRMRLLGNRILCRVIKKSTRKGDFRIYHYEYSVKTLIGRVLLTGDKYDGNLKAGDYVIYTGWTGREFHSPDETLVLLGPDNIEAVIDRESK